PRGQFIAGTGSWTPVNVTIGSGPPSTANVTLQDDVTFFSNQLVTTTGSFLNTGGKTLTLTGPMNSFGGRITGTGLVRMQPVSGSPRLGTNLIVDPAVEIASGTARVIGTIFNGKLTIASGAALSLLGAVEANGDFENNGTLTVFSDGQMFNFKGGTFTNNGFITGNVAVNMGSFFGPPLVQNLAGTGSWAGSPRLLIDSLSTTTLLNDLNYNGGNLFVQGRLNTGAFTLSLPCNVPWGGTGDVIGNIRRTNLAACPGAVFAFGNPFTTIQFTSGIPPTDITVNVGLSAPAGFPGATNRTYIITPTGGGPYTATLRLHYLDSELNGNAESTLQLWRNNGTNWTPQGVSNRNTTQNWVEYDNVTQFSPWTVSGPNAPTAASVAVGGRVTNSNGGGIRNAIVTLTAPNGSTRQVRTGAFGYYRFEGVQAGETYIIGITAKRFTFGQPTIVIAVLDEVTGLDFTAEQLPSN
ncbi:MAG: carboxypeptidase regulatory-like domain-containing protein, partial [Saprospiraceae bacterium]|nr:carboxypeptidase regulatory-like domain-containing protein [Pyrinomonadaceae bacterium]